MIKILLNCDIQLSNELVSLRFNCDIQLSNELVSLRFQIEASPIHYRIDKSSKPLLKIDKIAFTKI